MTKSTKNLLKKIMQKAWLIARTAAFKFGGKAKQYLSGALEMAHQESKPAVKKSQQLIDLKLTTEEQESLILIVKDCFDRANIAEPKFLKDYDRCHNKRPLYLKTTLPSSLIHKIFLTLEKKGLILKNKINHDTLNGK